MKLLIFVLFLAFLIGCSDNSVNNTPAPSGNSNVILLSKDSIYTGSPYASKDSVEALINTQVDTMYCSFTLSSQNVLKVLVKYSTVASIDTIITLPNIYTQDYQFRLATNSINFNSKVYLELIEPNGATCYASLKNIKLWYIKRT